MNQDFKSLILDLEGQWRLERSYSTGERFEGIALFSLSAENHLKLEENGTLHLAAGQPLAATRNWIWTLSIPMSLTIWYDEKPLRQYHQLSLEHSASDNSWHGFSHHLCGADHYDGEYRFLPDHINISHHVKGPAKDYSFTSVFNR